MYCNELRKAPVMLDAVGWECYELLRYATRLLILSNFRENKILRKCENVVKLWQLRASSVKDRKYFTYPAENFIFRIDLRKDFASKYLLSNIICR